MFTLSLSPGAKDDVRALKAKDADAAALVIAVLQEIQGSQELLDSLTIHDFRDELPELDVEYDVKHFWEHWKQGKNLWRLKIVDDERLLAGHRIIYAYVPLDSNYLVLGIVPRAFNYDRNNETTKRILREYDEYCT